MTQNGRWRFVELSDEAIFRLDETVLGRRRRPPETDGLRSSHRSKGSSVNGSNHHSSIPRVLPGPFGGDAEVPSGALSEPRPSGYPQGLLTTTFGMY